MPEWPWNWPRHTSVDRYAGEPIFSSTLPYTSSSPAKDSVELSSPAIVKPEVLLLLLILLLLCYFTLDMYCAHRFWRSRISVCRCLWVCMDLYAFSRIHKHKGFLGCFCRPFSKCSVEWGISRIEHGITNLNMISISYETQARRCRRLQMPSWSSWIHGSWSQVVERLLY